jgi:peptidylprolyl isomerase
VTQRVPRDVIPDDIDLEVGILLHAQGPDGETLRFTVADVDEDSVVVDGNHPLAGHDLIFDLELVEIA